MNEEFIKRLALTLRYMLKQECFCSTTSDRCLCAVCNARIAADLWQDEMSNIYDSKYDDGAYEIPCQYVSVWDGGIEVKTDASYYRNDLEVFTDPINVDGLDMCEKEYILFENGTTLDRYDSNGKENFVVL